MRGPGRTAVPGLIVLWSAAARLTGAWEAAIVGGRGRLGRLPVRPYASNPLFAVEARLEGTVVHGFGRTLGRSLLFMFVGVVVLAIGPVLLEEAGFLSRTVAYWVYGAGLALLLALVLNEMWMRGAFEVTEKGLTVTHRRLLQRRATRVEIPWESLRSFRFEWDAQGRRYLDVQPAEGPAVSLYGRDSTKALDRFATFEAAFRTAVATHNAVSVTEAVGGDGAPESASQAGIAEAPSFYSGRTARVGSATFAVFALGLVLVLFATGSPQAWRATWLLLIALGFAGRVWLPRHA